MDDHVLNESGDSSGGSEVTPGTESDDSLAAFCRQLEAVILDSMAEVAKESLALRWKLRDEASFDDGPTIRFEPQESAGQGALRHTLRVVAGASGEDASPEFRWHLECIEGPDQTDLLLKYKLGRRSGRPTSLWLATSTGDTSLAFASAKVLAPRDSRLDDMLRVWFDASDGADDRLVRPKVEVERPGVPGWPRWTGNAVEFTVPEVTLDASGALQTDGPTWCRLLARYAMFEVFCAHYLDKLEPPISGLPELGSYTPARPVNLKPGAVLERLTAVGLRIPWHVIEAACGALNAGKHMIFTGPPGCGKSKVAGALAGLGSGKPPLLATASSAWTSGDLVGRYLPERDKRGLKFRPGLFLQAVEARKWLIVDEFNRADIDQCFGELFSVLAGDAAVLPFEDRPKGNEGDEGSEWLPVRILPARGSHEGGYRDYPVPETFRLIGTMNDSDRAGLNQLSYALQRRFAIIPVEAPSPEIVKEIIAEHIDDTHRLLELEGQAWQISRPYARKRPRAELAKAREELTYLFAATGEGQADKPAGFTNLVAERVVGVSVVLDVIRFVGEGIRASGEEVQTEEQGDLDEVAECLVLSYLAIALVLFVFPQLEALAFAADPTEDMFSRSIEHIRTSFRAEKGDDDNISVNRAPRRVVQMYAWRPFRTEMLTCGCAARARSTTTCAGSCARGSRIVPASCGSDSRTRMTAAEPTPKERVSGTPDLELFAELVTWLPESLYGDSKIGLADWVLRQARLSEEDHPDEYAQLRRAFSDWLRTNAPEQIASEEEVARLLTDATLERVGVRTVCREEVGRDVDWGRTYSDSVSTASPSYWCRERVKHPDRELRGALIWLARAWRDLLRSNEDAIFSERIERLDAAVRRPQRTLPRVVPFTRRHLERLRRTEIVGSAALRALERTLSHQLSLPDPDTRRHGLLESLQRTIYWQSVESEVNLNLLLEISVRMGIARVAREQGWTLERDSERGSTKGDGFVLLDPDRVIKCELGKGPLDGQNDLFRELRHEAGMDPECTARDGQPDLVLRFGHVDPRGRTLTVMGDMKRNAAGDGRGLFREGLRTATYYMMAYAHELGIRIEDNRITSAIHPAFTLFFRQGVTPPDPAKDARDTGRDEPPVLVALDMESHFPPGQNWDGCGLADWFRAVAAQVTEALRTAEGTSR